MTNLDYLENRKDEDDGRRKDEDPLSISVSEWEIEYRRTKALEIIAEQTIHLDSTLGAIVTVLENIETALNRR